MMISLEFFFSIYFKIPILNNFLNISYLNIQQIKNHKKNISLPYIKDYSGLRRQSHILQQTYQISYAILSTDQSHDPSSLPPTANTKLSFTTDRPSFTTCYYFLSIFGVYRSILLLNSVSISPTAEITCYNKIIKYSGTRN